MENLALFYNEMLTDFEKKHLPKYLFHKGKLSLLTNGRRVSIVGSRKVSDIGKKRAEFITKFLVENEFCIVSGLAEGVDTIAHLTAIENNGNTIAVIGTSIDQYFPKSNINLQNLISKEHLLLSQFPSGYPTNPKNFPIRNRTMALISDATIIIEASDKSGTKHQGWEALKLGREVFLMENIVKDGKVSWAQEMIEYGAQVLTNENYKSLLLDIPFLTSKESYAF